MQGGQKGHLSKMLCKRHINLGSWEAAHLPLPLANINTHFSPGTK